MSPADFAAHPQGHPVPFSLAVPSSAQDRLAKLVRDAEVGVPSYYNMCADTPNGTFGISRDWLARAQEAWTSPQEYSWSAHQDRLNSFPQFRIDVTLPLSSSSQAGRDRQETFHLHFAALFSRRSDAIPVILLHGWPGAWFEFAEVLDLLAAKYTPETLPYHVVVPSIPDYGLSTRAGEVGRELTLQDAAAAMNGLMVALGFGENGYVAQGGDVGAWLARVMAVSFPECRAFHLNMYFMTQEQSAAVTDIPVTPEEQEQLARAARWSEKGMAYAFEQGTRPSTIALALMTNPLAMLAWMGEKFIEWSDNRYPISLSTILSITSFYWFTNSFGRAMWLYKELSERIGGPPPAVPISLTKPFGYSAFYTELAAFPRAWAEHLFPNLVFYKAHERGGHFAALEQPELFLRDLEGFVATVSPSVGGSGPGEGSRDREL